MHTRSQIPSAAALADLVESACSGQRDLFAAEGRQAAELVAVHAASVDAARQHRVDPGVYLRGVYADIGIRLGWSERTVSRLMNLAESLQRQLPDTLDAWQRGALGRQHAEVFNAELGGLDEDRRREIEQVLLQRMVDRPMPPARLRELARRLAETFERETMAERHRAAREERFVMIEPDRDGMAWLSVRLPAVDAVAAYQRTRAIARGLHAAATATQQGDLTQDAPTVDRRTFSQLHADVVRDLLVHGTCSAQASEGGSVALGTAGRDASGANRDSDSPVRDSARAHDLPRLGGGVRAQVQVVVPVDLLIDEIAGHPVISSGATAELRGYGAIDPVTALELAASADGLGRILTDPATGQVLEVGRSVYRPPAALARFVRERDQTCRFPGCAVPAQNCEIDHTLDWQWGGPTDASNLACLCRRHHVMKHHSSWSVMHVNDDADLLWTSPTGAVHQTFAPCTGPIRNGPGFETPPQDIDVESLVDLDPPDLPDDGDPVPF
ncbi:HNH endonuclease signature motif containing protein [Pseudoclavibacter sp. CFCC 11306]|uniref:HNH endonuclease signature motif containing protein n=1 Tax=Pseudoclavibacter sp. CFCC 11306 TaxID=1564493 RepID=UPI001301209E|nr:HNH endonuclease signature motif containing protein [Pseudoclavibacter sp. CFCC 11306]KAB1657569.1 DUF222 domain-containing protein [Pseudoclavibacter sp. CFCC 11306]